MLEEGFLRRWARRKTESRLGQEPPAEEGLQPAPQTVPAPAALQALAPVQDEPVATETAAQARLPTLDDVAQLTPESDFSAFVARGVDQAVRRGALKKLFSDPHFNVMDRLDVYIDDYTKPSPLPEGMLDSLQHAKKLFVRLTDDGDEAAPASPLPDSPQAEAEAEAEVPLQVQTQAQQPPEQEIQ